MDSVHGSPDGSDLLDTDDDDDPTAFIRRMEDSRAQKRRKGWMRKFSRGQPAAPKGESEIEMKRKGERDRKRETGWKKDEGSKEEVKSNTGSGGAFLRIKY